MKLFASIPGSTDWSSVCTCKVVVTCCSGFASTQPKNLQVQQQAQSQAQTQAQINALQQQNALLNQQLASQSISHIRHLQQLIPQQPSPQQTPPPQVPVQPRPKSPQGQSTVPTPTQPTLNSEEMLKKMCLTFQADLEEALKKPKETQQLPPTIPPVQTPPTLPQLLTLPSVAQPSITPGPSQPSRRSRSPVLTMEHQRDDKRPMSMPRSPPRRRARSTDSRRRRRRSSRSRRESSLTLRSVSPNQRSPSHEFSHDDPPRHSDTTKLYVPQSQSDERGHIHYRQGWSPSHQEHTGWSSSHGTPWDLWNASTRMVNFDLTSIFWSILAFMERVKGLQNLGFIEWVGKVHVLACSSRSDRFPPNLGL